MESPSDTLVFFIGCGLIRHLCLRSPSDTADAKRDVEFVPEQAFPDHRIQPKPEMDVEFVSGSKISAHRIQPMPEKDGKLE